MSEPGANSPDELGWNEQSRTLRFAIPPSSPAKECRTCKAPIHWIETPRGKRMPVNPDGTSHFSTCAQAAEHRKPKPVTLTPTQLRVLKCVHDQVAIVANRMENRFAVSDLERKKLIALDAAGWRHVVTPAGLEVLEAHKPKARR